MFLRLTYAVVGLDSNLKMDHQYILQDMYRLVCDLWHCILRLDHKILGKGLYISHEYTLCYSYILSWWYILVYSLVEIQNKWPDMSILELRLSFYTERMVRMVKDNMGLLFRLE